jgi:predicted membrane protein
MKCVNDKNVISYAKVISRSKKIYLSPEITNEYLNQIKTTGWGISLYILHKHIYQPQLRNYDNVNSMTNLTNAATEGGWKNGT